MDSMFMSFQKDLMAFFRSNLIYNIKIYKSMNESNLKAPKSCWFPAYLHVTARRSSAPRARPCGFSAQHATKSPWTLQSVISLDLNCLNGLCPNSDFYTIQYGSKNTDQKTWVVVARHCVQVTFYRLLPPSEYPSTTTDVCTILLVLLLVLKPCFKLLAFRLWFWTSTSWP